MSEPLLIEYVKDKKPVLGLYFHWGAERPCCQSLKNYYKSLTEAINDPIEIAKTIIKDDKTIGMCLSDTWYNSQNEYAQALDICRNNNLPQGKSRNAGLIAITEGVIYEMEANACDYLVINIE